MTTRRIVWLSLLIAMSLSLWVTWPLGRDLHDAIPTSYRPEIGGPRYMIAGDPLQFLYQLWTLADAFTGKTPLFYHVYEFNDGNDAARYDPGSYYFPFGLLYAAGYAVAGRAGGWNIMLFVTIWLIYLMNWVLARRFCTSHLTAAVAALPSILLPYFHVSLLGGSPTGLGMLWVPVAFLGMDLAIRDGKPWGGMLAAVVLFISSWVDLHVFFFLFLATPVWMAIVLAFLVERQGGWKAVAWKRPLVALIPVFIGLGLAYLQTSLVKRSLAGTMQAKGRTVKESLGFALHARGWFDWPPANSDNLVYVGTWVGAVLVIGLLLLILDARRRKPRAAGHLVTFALVLAGIGGIAVLALGPNVPLDSHHLVWRALRTLIPPYKMIRQPAKIYCILAPFLAVGLALALTRVNLLFQRRTTVVALAGLVAAGFLWDYGRRLDPTICLLDLEQGAYRAIAEDAARCGRENRAMSIPIWPGDSHWNSLTEYYATLYRTKMLNGYQPSVSREYYTQVFERLEAMNMGILTGDRLDYLLSKKIGYLILQEDAFPDKVSPFPVFQTLSELLRHPRIQFLVRDGAVWAFKILEAPETPVRPTSPGGPACPLLTTWQWPAPDVATGAVTVVKDTGSGDEYVRLGQPDGRIQLPPRALYRIEGLRYLVSVRGAGTLQARLGEGSRAVPSRIEVASEAGWTWCEIPVPSLPGDRETVLALELTPVSGAVEVGVITLAGGPWKSLLPGESLTVPAVAFFRAGYSDLRRGWVHLDQKRVQADVVFYAPILPLNPGRYRIRLDYGTPAPAGTGLGELAIWRSNGEGRLSRKVVAGQAAELAYRSGGIWPLRLDLRFSRKGDLTLHSVIFERIN